MKTKIQSFFHHIAEKLPRQLRQPLPWCMLATALICSLAVTVTIFGHERGGTQSYYGLAKGSSCVMEDEVAGLYAENDAGSKLQVNQSPQIAIVDPTVRSGVRTSQSDSVSQADGATPMPTQLPLPSAGTAAAADSSDADDMLWNDSLQYLSSAHETAIGSTGRAPYASASPQATPIPDAPQTAGTPPIISYTLYNEAVSQQIVTFSLSAIDNNGTALTENSIILTCNDQMYTPVYTKDNILTYALKLTGGDNTVRITAIDAAGTSAEAVETIVYHAPQQDTVIVSVEATTVGFGYLIPPTAVTLEPDKPISYYVADLLTQYGYSITYTGDVETDFYLQSVGKTNAFSKPSIPADLKAKILADSDTTFAASLNESNYSPDALSQSNFTRDSGWMYCVNDQYYNVGMSYLIPVANDVIRVRYTLALGRDIGGGLQNTNWEKQW